MIELVNVKTVDPSRYDRVYACVRSMKSNPKKLVQVTDLSPSTTLFRRYLELKKQGRWNEASFQEEYVPTFIRELKSNQNAIEWLNRIYHEDAAGLKIAIGCFCDEESTCHRSVLGGLFIGVGCNISCNADYIRYWNAFAAK